MLKTPTGHLYGVVFYMYMCVCVLSRMPQELKNIYSIYVPKKERQRRLHSRLAGLLVFSLYIYILEQLGENKTRHRCRSGQAFY